MKQQMAAEGLRKVRQSRRTSAETFLLKIAVLPWKKQSIPGDGVALDATLMAQDGDGGDGGSKIVAAITPAIGT